MKVIFHCLTVLLLVVGLQARAQESALVLPPVTGGVIGGIPIAVVPFAYDPQMPGMDADIAAIVRADLARSGDFDPLADRDMIERPTARADVNFATWRALKSDFLAIGRVLPTENAFSIEFQLFNVGTGERLLGYTIPARPGEMRAIGHYIADLIYERLMRVPGAFSTRIAYVTAVGLGAKIDYKLMVADADGFSPQTIVRSREPLLSPAWSPDGKRLAYVSFESGSSQIWIQEIASGSRRVIASFKGINGAPSFSPDGSRLAVALSRTGNLEINIMDLATGALNQITNHWGIDTEPQWMPDGQSIVFTSDRSGRPQIYSVPVSGGAATRLSFQGEYNARPSVSYDGKKIASAMGNRNAYKIVILDRDKGTTFIISEGNLDESPSFAPNGRMVIYSSKQGGRGVLNAVSTNARVRQRLVLAEGDVREPAWSPLKRRAAPTAQ